MDLNSFILTSLRITDNCKWPKGCTSKISTLLWQCTQVKLANFTLLMVNNIKNINQEKSHQVYHQGKSSDMSTSLILHSFKKNHVDFSAQVLMKRSKWYASQILCINKVLLSLKRFILFKEKHGLIPRTFYFLFLSSRQVQTKCSFLKTSSEMNKKWIPLGR